MEIDVDNGVVFRYKGYTVKHWTPNDREKAGCLIKQCLESYGLRFEPFGADRDALEVEDFYYSENRGEFWVITDDNSGELVGTGAFYEIDYKEQVADEGDNRRVEIRKMYLAPTARGKRLGCTLLQVKTSPYLVVSPARPCTRPPARKGSSNHSTSTCPRLQDSCSPIRLQQLKAKD